MGVCIFEQTQRYSVPVFGASASRRMPDFQTSTISRIAVPPRMTA
jgi:hypothetical protein